MVRCQELFVKFKDRNRHQETLSAKEVTGADLISVTVNDLFVNVTFLNTAHPGKPCKIICYAMSEVFELQFESNIVVEEEKPQA